MSDAEREGEMRYEEREVGNAGNEIRDTKYAHSVPVITCLPRLVGPVSPGFLALSEMLVVSSGFLALSEVLVP